MQKIIYGVKDLVAENIIAIQLEDSEEVAKRNFSFALSKLKESPIRPKDLVLEPLGILDMKYGEIIKPEGFVFIYGVDVAKELIDNGTEDFNTEV